MIEVGRGRESVTDADCVRRDGSFPLAQRTPLIIDAAERYAVDVTFAVDGAHVPPAVHGHTLERERGQPSAAASETAGIPRHRGQRLRPGTQGIRVADRDYLAAGIDDELGHGYCERAGPDYRHMPAGKHTARLEHERCRAESDHARQRPTGARVEALDGACREHQRSTLGSSLTLGCKH